jgi:hypothetical protein
MHCRSSRIIIRLAYALADVESIQRVERVSCCQHRRHCTMTCGNIAFDGWPAAQTLRSGMMMSATALLRRCPATPDGRHLTALQNGFGAAPATRWSITSVFFGYCASSRCSRGPTAASRRPMSRTATSSRLPQSALAIQRPQVLLLQRQRLNRLRHSDLWRQGHRLDRHLQRRRLWKCVPKPCV